LKVHSVEFVWRFCRESVEWNENMVLTFLCAVSALFGIKIYEENLSMNGVVS